MTRALQYIVGRDETRAAYEHRDGGKLQLHATARMIGGGRAQSLEAGRLCMRRIEQVRVESVRL